MEILAYNLSWMLFNLILALVPVALTLILDQKLSGKIRLFVLFLWLLFLPNTIYLITDLQYLPRQLVRIDQEQIPVLVVMYAFIAVSGIITFLYSLKPFENFISNNKQFKRNKTTLYMILGFLVAFAVVLGKFQRTHSWYVFTEPLRVINDVYLTLTSPQLMILVFILGIVINLIVFVYFKLKKR